MNSPRIVPRYQAAGCPIPGLPVSAAGERVGAIIDSYHITEYAGAFAETYALLGMVAEAEARLDQFDEPQHRWMPTACVRIAVILGQEERALDYIEAAAEDQPRLMTMMLCPDDTGPLQDNPRFAAILARAGMPATVAATR